MWHQGSWQQASTTIYRGEDCLSLSTTYIELSTADSLFLKELSTTAIDSNFPRLLRDSACRQLSLTVHSWVFLFVYQIFWRREVKLDFSSPLGYLSLLGLDTLLAFGFRPNKRVFATHLPMLYICIWGMVFLFYWKLERENLRISLGANLLGGEQGSIS